MSVVFNHPNDDILSAQWQNIQHTPEACLFKGLHVNRFSGELTGGFMGEICHLINRVIKFFVPSAGGAKAALIQGIGEKCIRQLADGELGQNQCIQLTSTLLKVNQYLASKGKQTLTCSSGDQQSLHWLVSNGSEEQAIQVLNTGPGRFLSYQFDEEGRSLLVKALESRQEKLALDLISLDRPGYSQDQQALKAAIRGGCVDAVEQLFDVSQKDETELLFLSIESGNREVLAQLLDLGVNPNGRNQNGETPLTFALKARDNDDALAELLIRHGADLEVKNRFGEAPLGLAASLWGRTGRKELVELLEEKCPLERTKLHDLIGQDPLPIEEVIEHVKAHPEDLNRREPQKHRTPLCMAASEGNQEAVEILRSQQADPSIGDDRGWDALYHATGHTLKMVQALGLPDPNIPVRDGANSVPLHRAADRGDADLVSHLLALGADPNRLNILGSPILYAARKGHLDAVKRLTEKGGDPVKAEDPMEKSPRAVAQMNGHVGVAEFLKGKEGVLDLDEAMCEALKSREALASFIAEHPSHTDGKGRNLLHYWAFLGGDLALYQAMNRLDAPDALGRTPLHYAVREGHVDHVRALMISSDVNAKDNLGYYPLHWCCHFKGLDDVAEVLMESEATRYDFKDNYDWGLAHKAAEVGNVSMLKRLKDKVDLNAASEDGRTALHRAAYSGDPATIEWLKEQGLKCDQKDRSKQIPKDYARTDQAKALLS